MQLTKNIEIVDLALYLKKQKALILSDLHIGFEEMLNKQGVLVPRFQFKDLVKKIEKIIQKTSPKIIIINGDLKHEFGTISQQEWRETLKILNLLERNCQKLYLIKGNHDTILGPIAEKKDLQIKEQLKLDNTLIIHGDKKPKKLKNIKNIIMGHEHPAVGLRENNRVEKYKCFLKGKYKRKNLIVSPSLNSLIEGTDITQEQLLSPILKDCQIKKFEVFVVEKNKVLDFGQVKDILKATQ